MTIFQIECFLAVAEHLNFARAAEQMNISQPAITRQIQSLENELGGKLFQRSTRMVRLTENGHVFVAEAQTMAAAALRSVRRFSMNDRDEIIDFDIGCSNSMQLYLLEHVMEQLRLLHPTVHPRIQIMREPYFTEQLDEETLEAAIGFQFLNLNPSLQYRELKKTSFTCFCRKDSPLAQLEKIRKKDLEPYAMILLSLSTAPDTIISAQRMLANKKKPSQLYFCRTIESALMLVKSGYGISLLPEIYKTKDPELVRIPLEQSPLNKRFSFGVFYKTVHGKPIMKDFIRLLTEQFAAGDLQ